MADVVSFFTKDFDQKKSLKSIQLLFKQAGKIRENQIKIQLISHYSSSGIPKNYNNMLSDTLMMAFAKYGKLIQEKHFSKLDKNLKKIKSKISRISEKDYRRYLGFKKLSIKESITHSTFSRKQLHVQRKELKSFYYAKQLMKNKKQKNYMRQMKNITEKLGKWHDCILLSNHLRHYVRTTPLSIKEKRQLQTIIGKIKPESEIYLVEIKSLFQAYSETC